MFAKILDGIDGAVRQIAAPRQRSSVTISTSIGFAALWLVPRLSGFQEENPADGCGLADFSYDFLNPGLPTGISKDLRGAACDIDNRIPALHPMT